LKIKPEAHDHADPFIFQIVGYQNSGKTTLITKIIELLASENWKVGTVKHHGHGGMLESPSGKDSSRHIDAGAIASLVEGNGSMILQVEKQSLTLEDQIQIMGIFKVDFILIEGHKKAEFPKVVLLRDSRDVELLEKLTNVVAFFYWDQDLYSSIDCNNIPRFHINDEKGQLWLKQYLITKPINTFT
jgi:molybdopterin-guanine dinucleotide biosynthesis protein B